MHSLLGVVYGLEGKVFDVVVSKAVFFGPIVVGVGVFVCEVQCQPEEGDVEQDRRTAIGNYGKEQGHQQLQGGIFTLNAANNEDEDCCRQEAPESNREED
jgi:hypothetical protein